MEGSTHLMWAALFKEEGKRRKNVLKKSRRETANSIQEADHLPTICKKNLVRKNGKEEKQPSQGRVKSRGERGKKKFHLGKVKF